MSGMVPFTDNVRDMSNNRGYQFEFHCERCGNGYRSEFKTDKKGLGKSFLNAAVRLTGSSALGDIAGATDFLEGTGSAAKDKALTEATSHVGEHFNQCRGCGNWVCQDVCWNVDVGQCLWCSPSVAEELSKAQAEAQVRQMKEKAEDVDWTEDLDMDTRAKVKCPHCGAGVTGGKFCPECGGDLDPEQECGNCGKSVKAGTKFCPDCGAKVG